MDIAREERFALIARIFGGSATMGMPTTAGRDIFFTPQFGHDINVYALLLALEAASVDKSEDSGAGGSWTVSLLGDGSVKLERSQRGELASPRTQRAEFEWVSAGYEDEHMIASSTVSLGLPCLRRAMEALAPDAWSIYCIFFNGQWRFYGLYDGQSRPSTNLLGRLGIKPLALTQFFISLALTILSQMLLLLTLLLLLALVWTGPRHVGQMLSGLYENVWHRMAQT